MRGGGGGALARQLCTVAALSSFRVGNCYFWCYKLNNGCRNKRVGVLNYYIGKVTF